VVNGEKYPKQGSLAVEGGAKMASKAVRLLRRHAGGSPSGRKVTQMKGACQRAWGLEGTWGLGVTCSKDTKHGGRNNLSERPRCGTRIPGFDGGDSSLGASACTFDGSRRGTEAGRRPSHLHRKVDGET